MASHPENRDSYKWLKCHFKEHDLQLLMLTQIVTGKELDNLWTRLHELRTMLNIPSSCDCNSPQTFVVNFDNFRKKPAPSISSEEKCPNNSNANKVIYFIIYVLKSGLVFL